jgi:hypothetical protein
VALRKTRRIVRREHRQISPNGRGPRNHRQPASDDTDLRFDTFSLTLEGDALAPSFLAGDRLTVAPDIAPMPGDAVVVRLGEEYRCLRINADGDLWDAHGVHLRCDLSILCGVVLDRTPASH